MLYGGAFMVPKRNLIPGANVEQLILNDDVEKRVTEFKRVIEAVVRQELDLQETISLIIERGMDSMLADILGDIDQATWLASFHQLAARYPAEIYGFVA